MTRTTHTNGQEAGLPALDVRNLRVAVSTRSPEGRPVDRVIVDDISFTLAKGRVLGLIGESGAGKSSVGLASMAYGRGGCRIIGGEVWLNGTNILAQNAAMVRTQRGQHVTYVAQSAAAAFNPTLRLDEQVIEAAVYHGVMTRAEALDYATGLFAELQLPDPENFGKRYPHQVSGGQLQRAMTAMALCSRPDLIVFDEPTTALDVTTQLEVLAAMKRAIAHAGTAALYITHDLAVVAQIADEIMVMRHGRMVEHGDAGQIISQPREDYTSELVSVRSAESPGRDDAGQEPMLRVEHVTAGYGSGVKVLSDVSLALPRARTLAIVGESGSGKSTLARLVAGLLTPRSGTVIFRDEVLPGALSNRSKDTLRRLQMIYQMADTGMYPRHTVRRIIGRPLSFYFEMKGRVREQRIIELLRLIELDETYLDRYPGELSGGQKQRICIARALAAEPDLIICDEVTSALDPLVADGILRLLKRLQADTGVSYLFITHDIETVRAIADEVAVMHRGNVVRFGPKAAVLSTPFDDYTKKLLASVPKMEIGWLDGVLASREDSVKYDGDAL